MKAAWRIRRLALQQGIQPRLAVPLRFASTAAAPAAQPIQTEQPSPHIYQPNQAGPSNYATRPVPPPSAEPDAEDDASYFFTSHRPSTSLQDNLAVYSESDTRILSQLYYHCYRSNQVRDEEYASGMWSRYIRLSPTARSHLDYKTLQNILRAVVPTSEHLTPAEGRLKHGKGLAKELHKVDSKYGERMTRVLRDMEGVRIGVGEGGAGPRASDFRFVLSTLALVGDSNTAEALADDMRTRGLAMDIRMIDSRLSALFEWLTRSTPGSVHGHRAERVVTTLWQSLGDMSTFDLTPRNVTTTLLIQAVYAAKGHITNKDVLANLDVVLEDVCAKAYGVDMKYLTLGAEKEERLKGSHVYALVDYWGRKGDVWKMLSTYEVLAEQPVVVAQAGEVEVDEAEEIPTLSGMMQREAEDRRGMTMFGHRRAEMGSEAVLAAMKEGRDVPPHLDYPSTLTPTPSDKPTFSHFFPQPIPAVVPSGTAPALSYPHIRIHTETIAVLIRHTIAAGDMQLVNHILASALSSIKQVRTEWLLALQLRHVRTGGDPAHPEWFVVPGPRISVDHQWFWETDFFARKSDAKMPERRRFEMLLCEARAQLGLEREMLRGLRVESGAAALPIAGSSAVLPKAFDPSNHLKMINAAERKLDIVLENARGAMDTKLRIEGVKYARSAKRLERRGMAERERIEALEERRKARAGPRSTPAESPVTSRVGQGGGEEVLRMSSGWNGTDGVRMIGIA